ncbi:MAG: hypothetical protein UR12_C0019G0007 [candidate division TM6 bacterium GW2011_GWF2_30_66]|jgi:hypothetical protein|nr:MAG: hypothetical protein UR12_C0019G0007 [candidate division TM6 bacterium GW2011_GWF2_30_66]
MKFIKKILPIVAVSCLFGAQLKSANSASTDYATIEKASKIMCEFCTVIKEFFNKQNTESFNAHLGRFEIIIASVDGLTNEIKEKVDQTSSVKHKAFLNILNELRETLKTAYKALQTRSSKIIMTTFQKSLSKKFINDTKTKLENTKQYLTENEKNLVIKILKISENTLNTLPSDISCAAIISKIVKR